MSAGRLTIDKRYGGRFWAAFIKSVIPTIGDACCNRWLEPLLTAYARSVQAIVAAVHDLRGREGGVKDGGGFL